jgi:hypothetical protein
VPKLKAHLVTDVIIRELRPIREGPYRR